MGGTVRKGVKGFTLVEILLALAILGVGLVGILSVFVTGANSVRRAVEKTEVCFIAQLVFEEFKRLGHINISSLTSANIPILPQHYIDSGYSVATPNITDVGASTLNLKKVDLTVYKGARPIESFTTYIAKYVP